MRSRTARTRPRTAAALTVIAALVAIAAPIEPARAEIRQDIVLDNRVDFDRVLADFDAVIRGEGFQVYLTYDETRTAPHNGVSLTYRHVEYSINDYSGRSVTATFFVLVEPDEELLDALKAYVAYNYSYGGNSVFRISGLGILNWYEWGPMGASSEIIDNQLGDWREQYLEGP